MNIIHIYQPTNFTFRSNIIIREKVGLEFRHQMSSISTPLCITMITTVYVCMHGVSCHGWKLPPPPPLPRLFIRQGKEIQNKQNEHNEMQPRNIIQLQTVNEHKYSWRRNVFIFYWGEMTVLEVAKNIILEGFGLPRPANHPTCLRHDDPLQWLTNGIQMAYFFSTGEEKNWESSPRSFWLKEKVRRAASSIAEGNVKLDLKRKYKI